MNTNDPVKCDKTLIDLNKAIKASLLTYLPETVKTIRFDMFEKNGSPQDPTISVFLYDIQEDLALRHGRPREYDAKTGTYATRVAYVRCCYLLTYWEKTDNLQVSSKAQHLTIMNMALNGLLNMQFAHEDLPPAFIRVVPPSEQLSGLGNFWQSMGDKPRLCLNFNVTIPVKLGLTHAEQEKVPAVRTLHPPVLVSLTEAPLSVQAFKRRLLETGIRIAVSKKMTDLNRLRAQLLNLQVQLKAPDEKPQSGSAIVLEGVVDSACSAVLKDVIKEMKTVVIDYQVKTLNEPKAPTAGAAG